MVYRFDGVQMRVEAGGDFGAFVHVLSRSRVVCHRLAARGWLLGADRRCCSSWISLTFTLRARIRALASACRRCAAAIASAARTTSPIVAVGVLTLDPRRQARARHRWRTAAPTGRRPSARPRVQSYPRLTTPTPTLESTTAHSHTFRSPSRTHRRSRAHATSEGTDLGHSGSRLLGHMSCAVRFLERPSGHQADGRPAADFGG
jgi:hypothetical protein